MSLGEFDIIARYFNRQRVPRRDVKLGIGDDCALLTVKETQMIAVSTDTLVCGNHFLPDIDPADLAFKSLAVNLSDLAAMGADPAWLSLALTLPEVNLDWLSAFSDSLFEQLDYYGVQLIGGDTTRGPLSLTLTIHGLIPEGKALKRSGASVGDWIYVTGSLGDSAAGLALLQQRWEVNNSEHRHALIQAHLRPKPRILQGITLRDLASSALDISDGLLSDLAHILKASQCGARVDLDAIPYSAALKTHATAEQALRWALSGGEDYELCFTVPEIYRVQMENQLTQSGVPVTCIGRITNNAEGLVFVQNNQPVTLPWRGYDHFSSASSE